MNFLDSVTKELFVIEERWVPTMSIILEIRRLTFSDLFFWKREIFLQTFIYLLISYKFKFSLINSRNDFCGLNTNKHFISHRLSRVRARINFRFYGKIERLLGHGPFDESQVRPRTSLEAIISGDYLFVFSTEPFAREFKDSKVVEDDDREERRKKDAYPRDDEDT